MYNIYISNSPQETEKIAQEFAKELTGGEVIAFIGNLGMGKTCFTRGLAKGLGINEPITSPTFTIVNEYYGKFTLYHFDVYRIDDPDEMYEIGYDEYIDGDGVCVIEWPQLIDEILPEKRYNIHISKNYDEHDDYRKIIIEAV